MQPAPFTLIADLIEDAANGWSIGSFGAIGEFIRDADEPARIRRTAEWIEVVSLRGAIRATAARLIGVAWDSLSPDSASWDHTLVFCSSVTTLGGRTVTRLGRDGAATRGIDRRATLFDLGVAAGNVQMCIRTDDAQLIATLSAAEGAPLMAVPGIMHAMLAAQPHRVLLSPAGRIEVFQPIPVANGASPSGPHTHLVPKVVAQQRIHAATEPVPNGLQSALSMHPPPAWRKTLGDRSQYDPGVDQTFARLLDRFGLLEDKLVSAQITAAMGSSPSLKNWPASRRGRQKARIVLRRLVAAGDERAVPWRAMHDSPRWEISDTDDM